MGPKRSRWVIYVLLLTLVVTLAFSTYLLENTLMTASSADSGPYPPPGPPGDAVQPAAPSAYTGPYPPPGTPGVVAVGPAYICATIFPMFPDLPPDKRAIEERDYQDCVNARNSPPPTLELTQRPLPTNAPTIVANIPRRRAGAGTIIETGLAAFPSYYSNRNQWFIEKGDKIIRVFAGAQRGDGAKELDKPWPGLLIVVVSSMDNNNYFPSEGGAYQTPVRVGPVRIVDANGMQLTLVSDNGQVFVFDVSTRKFIPQKPDFTYSRMAGAGQIVESGVPPVPLPEDVFTNQWYEDKEGIRITLLAGSEAKDDRQGLVAVVTTSQNQPKPLSKETYPAPIRFGPLRVFDADGEKVTVTAGDNIFVFDVPSRRFISWPNMPPDLSILPTPNQLTP